MGLFRDYEIIGTIAEGGMSTVYRCIQTSLGRPVAIKVLSKQLMVANPEVIRFFEQESLIIARLAHPNIIGIIDKGIAQGQPYFVMEYVEGDPLSRLIKNGHLAIPQKLDLALQIGKGLAYAHKNAVVHRDIKPANILVNHDGRAVITDFGIANLVGRSDRGQSPSHLVMGTPEYMSPEQRAGETALTPASDMYSFGLLLFELFTGRRPRGEERHPLKAAADTPLEIDALIARCLEPDPERRTIAAGEFVNQLIADSKGSHIAPVQREAAMDGITTIKEKFALLDVIKQNTFGSVYLCENRINHRQFIIKKVLGTSRGYEESRRVSQIAHPHMVKVHGVSKNERAYIVVMDYVAGGSLRDRLVQPWEWRQAVECARSIMQVLAHAHREGIVHGNLRPSNVLFTATNEVKVADFCLEHHYCHNDREKNWYGVPGEEPSASADLFALGVILHEMLTGTLPEWERGGALAPDRRLRVLPPGLQKLIAQLADRRADRRPRLDESVLRMMNDLLDPVGPVTGVIQVMPKRGAWRRTWLLVGLLLTSTVLLAFYFGRLPPFDGG